MKHILRIRFIVMIIALAAIALAIIPWYSDYLQNKSLKQAGTGKHIEALHTAQRSVTVNPLSVDALFILAGAQQRVGYDEAARRSLIKATELQPQNYATWKQLAVYERDYWDEPDLAREHFEKAVSLNPQDKLLRLEAGLEGG